jgi:hypothetical protein
MTHRIWIELDHPSNHKEESLPPEFAKEQCNLANNMLARLASPEHLPLRDTFFWSEHERRYCYGGVMGYIVLTDHGHWFNLSYLGRETSH